MKKSLVLAAVALSLTVPAALLGADTAAPEAAKPTPEAKAVKREKKLRVVHGGDGAERPRETYTFLGVQTIPVDPALNAQLGLKRGMGLTVREVVDSSPAAGVLKEHDVLLKLNDQWLVTQHQLSVLIKSYNDGDEVTLTYVRGGKEQTSKVKLGKKEGVKVSMFEHRVPPGDGFKWTEKLGEFPAALPGGPGMHEQLQLLRDMHGGDQRVRDVIIQRGGQPAPRISIMRMPEAVMLFKDDEGAVELKNENGKQLLEVRDVTDKVLFSGDVSTPELREKLDAKIKSRLELVEARDTLEFVPEGEISIEQRNAIGPEGVGAERIRGRVPARALGNPVMRL